MALRDGATIEAGQPDLEQARLTATVAHEVVIKLKAMGLPSHLDDELAAVSTDLGDLWAAQKQLADRLESFLSSSGGWESVGDSLIDLRATADHVGWHAKSLRRAANKVARFAYRQASDDGTAGVNPTG